MERGWERAPAVAGKFYPASSASLLKELESFFKTPNPDPTTVAIMAPHAGYVYSGRFAGEAYQRLTPPKRAIILAPNHTGRGKRISIWSRGSWQTPLGDVKIDEEGAEWLLAKLEEKEGDREAHRFEHAAEVQVPFLQFLNPNVEILPIVLGPISPEYCAKLGTWLAELVQARPSLIVASTDMSHYIPADEAKPLDDKALARVEAVDGPGLYRVVQKEEISMCGFIPTTCLLDTLPHLKVKRGELLAYGHSGEVTKDNTDVVAYAAARFRS